MARKIKFKDKVIVISGGSSGLGLELAKLLVVDDPVLVLLARNEAKLEQAKQDILELNSKGRVESYSADIADEQEIKKLMDEVAAKHGAIDILVNSAGILEEGYFETQDLSVFESIMKTNYLGTVNAIHAALAHLKKSRGSIVNIASMASYVGAFGYTAYCGSKFAVFGFSEALRYELRPQRVSVTVVCPPEFEGPMVDGISDKRTPENKKLVAGTVVLSPEFVAKETYKGMQARKAVVITGAVSKVLAFLVSTFPSLTRLSVNQAIARVYQGPAKT